MKKGEENFIKNSKKNSMKLTSKIIIEKIKNERRN